MVTNRVLLVPVCSAIVWGLAALVTSQPSYAQAEEIRFFCGTDSRGRPATILRDPYSEDAFIIWVSETYSDIGYTPQRRCEETSWRFQIYYELGLLPYMTTGEVNGYPVVCVSMSVHGTCSGVLFMTVGDPDRVLQELLGVRDLGGYVIEQ